MRLLILCAAALAVAPPAASQADAPAPISLNEVVVTRYSTQAAPSSVSYSFRVGDGPETSAGYFGNGLRPAVASNPEAAAELGRFRSRRVQSVVGYGVVFGGVATSLAMGINEPTGERVYDPRTGETVDKNRINTAALVPLGVAVVGLIYGGANYSASGRHISRAVALYNDGLSVRAGSGPDLRVAPEVGAAVGLRASLRL